MLTEKQTEEIKTHLHNAQTPLFFFDNDADGLCAFLLLRRFLGRGKGIPVKSFPELDADYLNRVYEFGADYVFILDKPVVAGEFFLRAREMNIPVVWLDHHENAAVPEQIYYYNPLKNKVKSNEPVTDICYKVSERKDDLWIAVAGCIADNFIPDFYGEFVSLYPELADTQSRSAFDTFYKSQIGKIARMFNFALKDRTTNVVRMIKFLTDCKNPYEVLEETSINHAMHRKFNEINEKVQSLVRKAENQKNSSLIFFQYAGMVSISADIANELIYRFPDKMIIVAYLNGNKVNISARGKGIKDKLVEAIKEFKDASGGGHEDAAGARINTSDLPEFRKRIESIINV